MAYILGTGQKDNQIGLKPLRSNLMFKYNNTEFNTYSAKSKHFYSLLIANKTKYPNRFKTLSADLELSNPLQERCSRSPKTPQVKLMSGLFSISF